MAGKGQRDAGGISMLGDEILLKVLEKVLDRVDRQSWCLVCKEFLFLEASCRKYVHLLRSEILAPVLERYNQVEHLDLSSCVQVTDANLQTVGKVIGKRLLSIKVSRGKGFGFCGLDSLKECTSLQEVDLTNCLQVGDREVASLSRLSSLQSLKLTGCRKITDAGLATLARCKELRVLTLKWCVGLADSGIGHVASNCKKLHTLDLSFTDISDRGLASLAGLEHLEHLSLISCNNLSDWGLNFLRNGCKALQTLDAAKCSNVSSFGVIALADSSSQLQQLNLSYSKPISTLLFQSLQNLKMLQGIKLDGCNIAAADLGLIGKCCKELKEFSVSKCQGVTDAGIRGVVAACTGLHKLDLTCCRDLTDSTMDAVAAGCRGLFSLKMENCCLVTAEGLALIGIGCPFLEELDCTDCNLDDNVLKSVARCAALRLLKVGYCMNITNSGLFYISTGCKNLREFDCYRSVGVGDPGVAAIANGCSRLKVINLSYCASITDESLLSISQLRDLVQLELRACVLVTSVGISCVAASCKHLKELDTKRCSFVDDSGILAVAKGCPNLRQINMSYTAVTNVGMMAIARMSCMQDMKLVHVKNVTSDCFAEALLACRSLKKVKLLTGLRMVLPTQVVKQIEDRGTRLRWMEKLA